MTTIFKNINAYEHDQEGDEMMERFHEILACHPRFPLHRRAFQSPVVSPSMGFYLWKVAGKNQGST